MNSTEVYEMLIRRVRRGLVVFRMLWYASAVSAVTAWFLPGGRPWTVVAFLILVYSQLGLSHVRKQHWILRNVAENPKLVYWMHPVSSPLLKSRVLAWMPVYNLMCMLLHLRDGTEVEVALPPDQMRIFTAWMTERNPSLRFGDYDQEGGKEKV